MGNDDRCCTRLRAKAIFLSPASLLIEFMRSLRRRGSVKVHNEYLFVTSRRQMTRTRDMVVHTGLETPLAVADHCARMRLYTSNSREAVCTYLRAR